MLEILLFLLLIIAAVAFGVVVWVILSVEIKEYKKMKMQEGGLDD